MKFRYSTDSVMCAVMKFRYNTFSAKRVVLKFRYSTLSAGIGYFRLEFMCFLGSGFRRQK